MEVCELYVANCFLLLKKALGQCFYRVNGEQPAEGGPAILARFTSLRQ